MYLTFATLALSWSTSRRSDGFFRFERPAAGGADDEDDRRVWVVAERLAEQAAALLALRGGVGEAGRLEVVLDVVAEGDGDEDEDADGGEDELRARPGEVGDPVHGGGLYQNSKCSL